jgi:hypothetical protein
VEYVNALWAGVPRVMHWSAMLPGNRSYEPRGDLLSSWVTKPPPRPSTTTEATICPGCTTDCWHLTSSLLLTHSTSEPSACPPSSLDPSFSSLELRGSSLREYSGDSRDVLGHSAIEFRPT